MTRKQREQRAQRRLQLIEQEAAQGAERQAAITAGWAALQQQEADAAAESGNVQAFARELAAQRAVVDAALQGKQAAVEARVAELRARDEEYVKAVQQQGRDVDALLAKMRTDSVAMQARYEVRV